MINENYQTTLNKWMGGGQKPRAPENLKEIFAYRHTLITLRNPTLFHLRRQRSNLLSGLGLENQQELDPDDLR